MTQDKRVIEIHIHVSPDEPDPNVLKILGIVQKVQTESIEMALDLTDLQAKVTRNTDVAQSAVVLIQELAAAFASAQGDPAAIAALSDQLNASAQALADAVVAGTPAAPTA